MAELSNPRPQQICRKNMDELREVKLEDEPEEDVGIQMTNDAPDGSIPKYTIVGTLKRKRVDPSEYANSNFAPSKNSQTFENPPKLEPLDDEIVNDDSNSSLAPKQEPKEQQGYFSSLAPFMESPPKLEPQEGVQETSSNLAPFFGNLLEDHVKQEEEPYYPTSEQEASCSPDFPPKEPKEEPPEECIYQQHGSSFLNLPPLFLENPVKEEDEEELAEEGYYQICGPEFTRFSNFPPILFEREPKVEQVEEGFYETEVYTHMGNPISTAWDQRASLSLGLGLEMAEVKEEESLGGGSWTPDCQLSEPKFEEQPGATGPWALVKEEEPSLETPSWNQASGFGRCCWGLGEPKVEEPYLSTGSHSDQGSPLPKYTIWNQRAPSTSQGMYEMKEELLDEQSKPSESGYEVFEPPVLNEPKMQEQSFGPIRPPSLSCCLCGIEEHPQRPLNNVPVKSELLILAVGLKLAGKLTIKKGRELMTRTQSSYSCQEHYREAAEKIQTALDVEPLRQGLKKIRRHDLEVIRKICPQMTMERFRERFREFHEEHHKKPAVISHCEICNRDQYRTKMTNVSNKGTKYLLAIADMLQGYRNPAQAVSFASGTHAKKVCIIHFKATLNVILARLNLRSASEQPKAQDLVELMSSVRMVWKDCKTKMFWDTFRWFAVQQQKLKPLMAPRAAPCPPLSEPTPTPAKPTLLVFLCSLCSKNSPFVRPAKEKSTKLVLAVGACLSKHTTPKFAKQFMAGDETALVCGSHFDTSIPSILSHLRILSLSDSPATKPLYVMSLVESICATKSIGYECFVRIVNAFAKEHHLPVSLPRNSQTSPTSF